jgi:hypothetical protein
VNDPAASRDGLGARLRDKLPEILIEAGSVVVALLLAFAINAWHEREQENERAAIARTAILAELRTNAAEIGSALAALGKVADALKRRVDGGEDAPRELHVSMSVSLLSSAAWRATLATQASQRLDFEWLTGIAKVYELQDVYVRMQDSVVEQVASMPSGGGDDPKRAAAALVPRISALSQLAAGLERAYADALGGEAVQPAAK